MLNYNEMQVDRQLLLESFRESQPYLATLGSPNIYEFKEEI